jgi:conjugative transfer region protein TrbK
VDTKLLARIGAIIFVAIAITMTAIQLRETPKAGADPELVMIDEPDADPLRAEVVRCSRIGEAGASDPACLRAWAENRRRFLAPGARPKERMPAPSSGASESQPSGGAEPLGNDSMSLPDPESHQMPKGAR